MKKIIKRKLHISTYSRDFIDYINHEFYSHDKHNAFFEFTMEQLPTDNVVALFYFQKTKRYTEIRGVVEDNKVTIEFDTSLITTNETVCGYIYFEKVEQSADVCRFCFNVKVSEIDKLSNAPIVEKETRRLIPMSEIVTKTELQELFKTIERNGGTYNDKEIRSSISSIKESIETLKESDKTIGSIFRIVFNNFLRFATNDALNQVEQRVEQLEQNRGSDSSIENRLTALESKHTVDTSGFAKKSEVPTVESVTDLTQKFGEQANKIQVLETKAGYETHGTGMPNGRVTASIGTTYIDTAKTNGALKWIKTTDGGNIDWKVAEGDTGWVLVWKKKNDDNTNKMYFRRKNDVVHVKFIPEVHTSEIGADANLILDLGGYFTTATLSIDGFKPVDDVFQTIYKTSGELYRVGDAQDSQGTGDVIIKYNYYNTGTDVMQLQIITGISGVPYNHVNPFSYLTEDEWPTVFPTVTD